MNMPLRPPRMTQDEFFAWADACAEDRKYEFDGFRPVAVIGGTRNHGRIQRNILFALISRLNGGDCEALGSDAGVTTVGGAVRYPDALVTCTKGPGTDRLIPGVVVVFEVLSPTSERNDRIDKLREYRAVPSILSYVISYVILEYESVGLIPTALRSDPYDIAPSLRATLAVRQSRGRQRSPFGPGLPHRCAPRNDGNGQSKGRLVLHARCQYSSARSSKHPACCHRK